MAETTAVILAAGMGVRMGPRGKLVPKGLLEVGGETLIEQSVAALRGHGVARIVIVTGHLAEQYQALFDGTDVELVYNATYATTGNLRTLATGLPRVQGACLIVESDLIYAPQMLEQLDGSTSRFLVSGPTGAGDEHYAWGRPGPGGVMYYDGEGKDPAMRRDPPLGEMIGLTVLSAAAVPRMTEIARAELTRDPGACYEAGLVALSREMPIECPILPNTPWAEIDDEDMLKRAREVVYPRIAAARAAFGPR